MHKLAKYNCHIFRHRIEPDAPNGSHKSIIIIIIKILSEITKKCNDNKHFTSLKLELTIIMNPIV